MSSAHEGAACSNQPIASPTRIQERGIPPLLPPPPCNLLNFADGMQSVSGAQTQLETDCSTSDDVAKSDEDEELVVTLVEAEPAPWVPLPRWRIVTIAVSTPIVWGATMVGFLRELGAIGLATGVALAVLLGWELRVMCLPPGRSFRMRPATSEGSEDSCAGHAPTRNESDNLVPPAARIERTARGRCQVDRRHSPGGATRSPLCSFLRNSRRRGSDVHSAEWRGGSAAGRTLRSLVPILRLVTTAWPSESLHSM